MVAVEVVLEEEQQGEAPEAVEELALPQVHPPQVESHQQRELPAGQPLAQVRVEAEAAEEVVAAEAVVVVVLLLRLLRYLRLPCSWWI